jgi:hypothetical protein
MWNVLRDLLINLAASFIFAFIVFWFYVLCPWRYHPARYQLLKIYARNIEKAFAVTPRVAGEVVFRDPEVRRVISEPLVSLENQVLVMTEALQRAGETVNPFTWTDFFHRVLIDIADTTFHRERFDPIREQIPTLTNKLRQINDMKDKQSASKAHGSSSVGLRVAASGVNDAAQETVIHQHLSNGT